MTAMVKVALSWTLVVSVAVTVADEVPAVVGVPVIRPVVGLRVRQIGRASGRERGEMSGGGGALEKKRVKAGPQGAGWGAGVGDGGGGWAAARTAQREGAP